VGACVGGHVWGAGRHAVVTSGGNAFHTGRPTVGGLQPFDFDFELDFELDPAAGTLTVRLDGAPHHVLTGLTGRRGAR
jgi:hypothetical protein